MLVAVCEGVTVFVGVFVGVCDVVTVGVGVGQMTSEVHPLHEV